MNSASKLYSLIKAVYQKNAEAIFIDELTTELSDAYSIKTTNIDAYNNLIQLAFDVIKCLENNNINNEFLIEKTRRIAWAIADTNLNDKIKNIKSKASHSDIEILGLASEILERDAPEKEIPPQEVTGLLEKIHDITKEVNEFECNEELKTKVLLHLQEIENLLKIYSIIGNKELQKHIKSTLTDLVLDKNKTPNDQKLKRKIVDFLGSIFSKFSNIAIETGFKALLSQ